MHSNTGKYYEINVEGPDSRIREMHEGDAPPRALAGNSKNGINLSGQKV